MKIASLTDKTKGLYAAVAQAIYAPQPTHLGFPDQGMISNYYPNSSGATKDEISKVHDFIISKGITLWNTRLRKGSQERWELLIASVNLLAPVGQDTTLDLSECGEGFDGAKLVLVYGDYSAELQRVVDNLKLAKKYAANKTQEDMLNYYISLFLTGSIDAHRDSQIAWIRDASPSVETNLGFIETYRDPYGIHAEWDGLVAIVNKEQSLKYRELVSRSSEFIAKLPWNTEFATSDGSHHGPFERRNFEMPDFTSLESKFSPCVHFTLFSCYLSIV